LLIRFAIFLHARHLAHKINRQMISVCVGILCVWLVTAYNSHAYDWCACRIPMCMIRVRNTMVKVWLYLYTHANHMLTNIKCTTIERVSLFSELHDWRAGTKPTCMWMISVRIIRRTDVFLRHKGMIPMHIRSLSVP